MIPTTITDELTEQQILDEIRSLVETGYDRIELLRVKTEPPKEGEPPELKAIVFAAKEAE